MGKQESFAQAIITTITGLIVLAITLGGMFKRESVFKEETNHENN